jgi:hypothetical protein
MRALLFIILLVVTNRTTQAQQFNANELLQMLSFSEAKVEAAIQKKGYVFSAQETKGDTAYKTYKPHQPFSKRKKEFINRSIALGHIKEDPVIHYNTAKPEDFAGIKATLEKNHFIVTKLYEGCPPLFLMFLNKEYTVTCQTFKEDTVTIYSFLFLKKILPEKQTIHFAEDLLQFDSHEHLAAVFGASHLKSDGYYFSDEEVNKCTVLFPNTPMQAVFIWGDELHMQNLSSLIIGGRDEMKKPSEHKNETVVSENKWRFHNNIYIGISLQKMRSIHGENFEIYTAKSKFTGLINSAKTGKIDFSNHQFVMGCVNCNESQAFTKKERISADEATRKGLILFLLSVTLFPEKRRE